MSLTTPWTSAQLATELGLSVPFTSAQVAAACGLTPPFTSAQVAAFTPRTVASITIAANTQNYTLNTAKVSGYVAGQTDVTLTINSGIIVGSSSTGAAIFVDTSWAAGDTVSIVNNGYIVGRGGTGGTSGSTTSAGAAGGLALQVLRATSITNNGTIGGGGGGGGGTA